MTDIEPDYIGILSPEERLEVNRALHSAITFGTGIILFNAKEDHAFTCDPEVQNWCKRLEN